MTRGIGGGIFFCVIIRFMDITGGLTVDETLFVYEFLKDRNRTKAAERVGKNPAWAATWGSITYRNPKVKAAIDAAMEIICERAMIDAEWVLREHIELYNVDLQEIITVDELGEPTFDLTNASPELWKAIESIEISPSKYGTKIKVILPTKAKILETVGKHISVNAFKEHIEHSGAVQVVFDDQDLEA